MWTVGPSLHLSPVARAGCRSICPALQVSNTVTVQLGGGAGHRRSLWLPWPPCGHPGLSPSRAGTYHRKEEGFLASKVSHLRPAPNQPPHKRCGCSTAFWCCLARIPSSANRYPLVNQPMFSVLRAGRTSSEQTLGAVVGGLFVFIWAVLGGSLLSTGRRDSGRKA